MIHRNQLDNRQRNYFNVKEIVQWIISIVFSSFKIVRIKKSQNKYKRWKMATETVYDFKMQTTV